MALRLAYEAPWMGQMPIETHPIATRFACHLCHQGDVSRALQLFQTQCVDPSHVLGLFPNLLPESIRSQIHYPMINPVCSNLE